jgi:hypothetical protein
MKYKDRQGSPTESQCSLTIGLTGPMSGVSELIFRGRRTPEPPMGWKPKSLGMPRDWLKPSKRRSMDK